MSYRTSAYGVIKVKSADDTSIVADIIQQLDIFDEVYSYTSNGEVEVIGDRMIYRSADFRHMYEDISVYVSSGSIEFTGDDNALWKHSYENGEWVEYDGVIEWIGPGSI